jgi:LacI family transcriptional regulator
MKDIAADLNLSVVTISKVLRNHPDIAKETRERVLKRVKELDYQPNILARSLVTGRSYLIGLVVPGLMHPFFAEIAMALSEISGKRGYSVIICSSEQDQKLEAREIRHLLARRLDALVIAASGIKADVFEQMDRLEQPYVLIDQEIPGLSANFVGVDDEAVGRVATEHLIDQGCRVIAHIRGKKSSTGTGRFEGYKQALLSHGMEFDESLVVVRSRTDIDSISQGAEAMRMLLKQNPRPDGVFCYNDPLAIGAMNVILEAGLRIPEDVAVIGCGNLYYNNSLRVPLSSMDQHSRMIGERAANILLDLLESKMRPQPKSVILNPTLVVRSSTMKKPQGEK